MSKTKKTTALLFALVSLSACAEDKKPNPSPQNQTMIDDRPIVSGSCLTGISRPTGTRLSTDQVLNRNEGLFVLKKIESGAELIDGDQFATLLNKSRSDMSQNILLKSEGKISCFKKSEKLTMDQLYAENENNDDILPSTFESITGKFDKITILISNRNLQARAEEYNTNQNDIRSYLENSSSSDEDSTTTYNTDWMQKDDSTFLLVRSAKYMKDGKSALFKSVATYQFIPKTIASTTPISPSSASKSRCGIKNEYLSVDNQNSFYFSNSADRLSAYQKLVQSGLCAVNSRFGANNNYITLDGKNSFYFSNGKTGLEMFMKIAKHKDEEFPRCGASDNYITLDQNNAIYFSTGQDGVDKLKEMIDGGLCK